MKSIDAAVLLLVNDGSNDNLIYVCVYIAINEYEDLTEVINFNFEHCKRKETDDSSPFQFHVIFKAAEYDFNIYFYVRCGGSSDGGILTNVVLAVVLAVA